MAVGEVVYKLSANATRLIKSGQAEWTKGGIRDVKTKKIIELAQPMRASSLTQKQMLDRISGSVQSLQALSWVNTALSLVNVGVSVAGFYMTLSRLESLNGDLRRFIDTYSANQKSDMLETYNNHLQKITNHLSYLQSRYTTAVFDQHDFMNRRVEIENECIETANFLIKVVNAYMSGQLDPRLANQIIFTLAPVYANLVNEYCCQYYCICRQQHNQFQAWLSVLDFINSDQFRNFMKMQMAFNVDYAELHPQRRKDVLSVSFDCIEEVKRNMILCADTIHLVPEDTMIPVEYMIQNKIWEDVSRNLKPEQQETPEEWMNHTIMQIAIDDNDEEVFVPMRMAY